MILVEGDDLLEVEEVKALDGFCLEVVFSNGRKRIVDLNPILDKPVFVSLRDKKEFSKVSVNPVGGVQWESGADLSAEFLSDI